jgi:hypothetical protein
MTRSLLLLICSLSITLFFTSCDQGCEESHTFEAYIPVYKSAEELNPEVTFEDQRSLENPGKIYYYGDYILINEQLQGVHIIDNSDLQNPQKIGFINIEGNVDIALKGDYIYADAHFNLVVIDISDIHNPTITHTIPNIRDQAYFDEAQQAFIVDYEYLSTEVEVACDEEVPFEKEIDGITYYNTSVIDINLTNNGDPTFFDVAGQGVPEVAGGGGSLARVAFIGDYFYYVNNYAMKVFSVEEIGMPQLVNTVYLDWGVETIFPYKDNIFIGANDGMHILDNRDPANPEHISTFRHARACDPVVVKDDIAYVTLRDGSECENFINQLDVIDISRLESPELIASFPMDHPHGLSVRGETLYLCEGDFGLKVFDLANLEEIHENLISHITDIGAFDVISISSDLLLLIGPDGFYQYDTKNPQALQLLSSIKIGA